MDFLFGSVLAIAIFYFLNRRARMIYPSRKYNMQRIVTQSYAFETIKPVVPILDVINKYQKVDSQMSKYEDSKFTRVLVLREKAYWISDNKVFSANVQDNHIDNETASVVDTMGMDDVQLKEMIFIIDTLTEGANDDSGNSRN